MGNVVVPLYKCRVCGKLHKHPRVGAGGLIDEGETDLARVAIAVLKPRGDYADQMKMTTSVEVCADHVGISDLAGFVIEKVE